MEQQARRRCPSRWPVAAILLCAICLGSPDLGRAQNNLALVHQENPAGTGLGNTLRIDQSLAEGARVLGPDLAYRNILSATSLTFALEPTVAPGPATQVGVGNVGHVVQKDAGALAVVLQTPLADGTGGFGNSLTINSTGHAARGAVAQFGSANRAALSLAGDHAAGLVVQRGSDHQAALTVGSGGVGMITQIGRNNATGSVAVAPGTQVSYLQVGTNLQPVGQTALQAMSTTPGMITVQQTAW